MTSGRVGVNLKKPLESMETTRCGLTPSRASPSTDLSRRGQLRSSPRSEGDHPSQIVGSAFQRHIERSRPSSTKTGSDHWQEWHPQRICVRPGALLKKDVMTICRRLRLFLT